MTVRELIELLEEYDGDYEVLLAHQPSWPLQFTVSHVISHEEILENNYDEDEDEESEPEDVVYIVEGGHPGGYGKNGRPFSPYAPRGAWF